jgi:hypothetical protein
LLLELEPFTHLAATGPSGSKILKSTSASYRRKELPRKLEFR